MNTESKFLVTEAPHVRARDGVRDIMLDVIIALMPALIAGTVVFGYRVAAVAAVCIASCVLFEWLWCRLVKKPSSISDLSAAVTGLLLALNMPVTIPLWMPIIGSLFAIVIVKQFFGGIGHNFMNPALAARAFMLTSWAQAMTNWTVPFAKLSLGGKAAADAVSSATPLALLKSGSYEGMPTYLNLFLGNAAGCIGEVSALAILIGAAYLLYRRVIKLRVPLCFILTVFAITWIFGKNGWFTGDALRHILSGGVLLGAFFMATDYTTTPYTPKGQIIFGIGCGIITAVIRLWGAYPEGVSYSILLMNAATPLIDRYTAPKRFGTEGGKLNAK